LPADATRPDIPVWPGDSAEPEAGPATEASPPPGEGQVGPPERSHG
jgi:hypothetical protein